MARALEGWYCFSEASFSGGEFVGRLHRATHQGDVTLCGLDTTRRGWAFDKHEDDGGADDISCKRCKTIERSKP